MERSEGSSQPTRRQFLKALAIGSVVALAAPLLSGCAEPTAPAAQPTAAPATAPTKAPEAAAPTKAPEAAAGAEPTATPAPAAPTPTPAPEPGRIKSVPRDRTVIVMWQGQQGKYIEYDIWNPFAIGASHQIGANQIYEPLAYYSAFDDKLHLWLAEDYQYSPDFKELTVKTRKGISWSDGTPFSAHDVAYTFSSLKELGPAVIWGTDVQQYVDSANATDDNTVVFKFKIPAPRFFDFITYKFDIGVYIAPKHIFEGQDWSSFKHFDLERGWPVTTGPWKVVAGMPEQKIFDRRDDWWAVKQGLVPHMPKMDRVLWLPLVDQTAAATAMIRNEIDHTLTDVLNVKAMVEQNPAVTTHAGRQSPYGYVDWWPLSVYVNCSRPPFDDPDVRWALSYYLDREQVIEVGFGGEGSLWPVPMPSYKPLRPYVDAIQDLLEKYNTLEYNPAKGDQLLLNKGWKKGSDGIWVSPDGTRLSIDVMGFFFMSAYGPVVAEQFKRAGVEAQYVMPPNAFDLFSKGEYTGCIFGHGGSVKDPYETLRLYQSATLAIPGAHQVNFPKWGNKEYDRIVDEVYMTPPDDKKKLLELYRQAMEIWLPELPDIQLTEFYHNIALNTAYWKNWPSVDNPYINEASWHLTWNMVLWNLEPAG